MKVFATHKALPLSGKVPGMPLEYVFRLDYQIALDDFNKKVTKLEHQNAVLERVIARQDVMLVAGSKHPEKEGPVDG